MLLAGNSIGTEDRLVPVWGLVIKVSNIVFFYDRDDGLGHTPPRMMDV